METRIFDRELSCAAGARCSNSINCKPREFEDGALAIEVTHHSPGWSGQGIEELREPEYVCHTGGHSPCRVMADAFRKGYGHGNEVIVTYSGNNEQSF